MEFGEASEELFVGDFEIAELSDDFGGFAFNVDELGYVVDGFLGDFKILEFLDEFLLGDFFGIVDYATNFDGFFAEAEGVEETV